MKLHTKAQNGIAILILLAQAQGNVLSLQSMAQRLGLSKLYLEQVLSVLKAQHWVESMKGPQGGYRYQTLKNLSLFEVLSVLEPSLCEDTQLVFLDQSLNQGLDQYVLNPLSQVIQNQLLSTNIEALANKLKNDAMYYI